MKKVISLVLAAVMVVSIFAGLQISSSALAPTGKCGDNIYWSFDSSTGTLTLSGSGETYGYSSGEDIHSPFHANTDIKKIIVEEGIEQIGQDLFFELSNLQSISLPDSLWVIDQGCFWGCSSLESITLPMLISYIEPYAFIDCDALKDVYYKGGKGLWVQTEIGEDNECLLNAKIHFMNGSHEHQYDIEEVVKTATCTGNGKKEFTCECGDIYSETIPALGHKYSTKTVAPKANALGYVLHTCSRCKGSYKTNFKAPTGKPSGLKCAARTASAEKIAWNKTSGATGYQVQLLNSAGKIAGNKVLTGNAYSFSKLTAGHAYKARVRFYIKATDGKNYYGAWATINSPTLPAGTSLTKVTGAKKAFTAQWKKGAVTGYQLQYATNNKFSGAKTVTIKKAATLKYTVSKLAASKTFYVRVRTYKAISGANYYSTWSAVKAVKTK